MKKISLLTPGPTPVPFRTLLAMAKPLIHHRSSDFKNLIGRLKKGLKKVFQTKNEVLIFCSTGTGAMESSVANLLSLGDRVLVIRGGKFGDRWFEILNSYGCDVLDINIPWGKSIDPQKVKDLLSKDSSIKAVYVQALETSTGVDHPIKEIAEVVKDTDAVLVVDAISALGAYNIAVDRWGIDVLIAGSQKALMIPPGLSFVSISSKALGIMEKSSLPKFYFSWKKELSSQKENKGAFTSPVSLFVGLLDILDFIEEYGIEKLWKETEIKSRAFKAAVKAWGLKVFSEENPSFALTAVDALDILDVQKMIDFLKDNWGIFIAGGQSHLKGRIFRVSHMGYVNEFDTLQVINAIEIFMNKFDRSFRLGVGASEAQRVFSEEVVL